MSLVVRSIDSTGDLYQIALPAISANALNRRCHMAHGVRKLPGDSGKSVLDTRIQRILSITAAYYGLAPAQDVTGIAGGLQA